MRNKKYEAEALEAIGAEAKADSATTQAYAHQVEKRLEHGAEQYGDDAWFRKGVDRCAAEVADEGTDLAGWVLGTLQVLNKDEQNGKIGRDEAHTCRFMLMRAAAFGLQAWVAAEMARDVYRDATGEENLHQPRGTRPRPFSDPDPD